IQWQVARQWRAFKRHNADSCGGAQLLQDEASVPPEQENNLLLKERLAQFLKGVDDIDRQLVELRLQGYKTAEAARELGLAPGFLRVRLLRLRQQLRSRPFARQLA